MVELPCGDTPSVLHSQHLLSLGVVGGSKCNSSSTSTVWPAPERFRHRGLVVVYLTKVLQQRFEFLRTRKSGHCSEAVGLRVVRLAIPYRASFSWDLNFTNPGTIRRN